MNNGTISVGKQTGYKFASTSLYSDKIDTVSMKPLDLPKKIISNKFQIYEQPYVVDIKNQIAMDKAALQQRDNYENMGYTPHVVKGLYQRYTGLVSRLKPLQSIKLKQNFKDVSTQSTLNKGNQTLINPLRTNALAALRIETKNIDFGTNTSPAVKSSVFVSPGMVSSPIIESGSSFKPSSSDPDSSPITKGKKKFKGKGKEVVVNETGDFIKSNKTPRTPVKKPKGDSKSNTFDLI